MTPLDLNKYVGRHVSNRLKRQTYRLPCFFFEFVWVMVLGITHEFFCLCISFSRWWQLKYVLYVHPPTSGEMIQFDEHKFQMGRFNHQLACVLLFCFFGSLLVNTTSPQIRFRVETAVSKGQVEFALRISSTSRHVAICPSCRAREAQTEGNGSWQVDYMGVSWNRGIPKWMVYNGKPYLNRMIWGYHHFRKPPYIHHKIHGPPKPYIFNVFLW